MFTQNTASGTGNGRALIERWLVSSHFHPYLMLCCVMLFLGLPCVTASISRSVAAPVSDSERIGMLTNVCAKLTARVKVLETEDEQIIARLTATCAALEEKVDTMAKVAPETERRLAGVQKQVTVLHGMHDDHEKRILMIEAVQESYIPAKPKK